MKNSQLARELYETIKDNGEVTLILSNEERKFIKNLITKQYPKIKPSHKIIRWIAAGIILIILLMVLLSGCTPLW